MLSSITNSAAVAVALALALLPLAQSQFVSNLPQCIRDCINQSQDSNCQVTDIACLCRASAGNFLPDLITCMHGNCIDFNTDVLLDPMQFACDLAGAPIPDSAVRNAKNQASSLASQVTKTVTVGGSGTPAVISTATVTTTNEGSTLTLLYPVTIEKTTTVSGEPSTITPVSTEDQTSAPSTTLASSTVAGAKVTSTDPAAAGASETSSSASQPAGQANSAPFTNTNGASGARLRGMWFGLSGLLVGVCVWL